MITPFGLELWVFLGRVILTHIVKIVEEKNDKILVIYVYSRRKQIWLHFKTSLTSQKLLFPEKLWTSRTHIHKFPVRVSRLELSQNQCYVRYHTKLIFRISEFFANFPFFRSDFSALSLNISAFRCDILEIKVGPIIAMAWRF